MDELLTICETLNAQAHPQYQLDAHGRCWKRGDDGVWRKVDENEKGAGNDKY